MTNTVAIIPARKGSKGVPGKNVKLLGNIPLIAHTIIEAKKVISPDRIFVSTDSTQIADIAHEYGVRPSVLRPESLSLDETPMHDVLLHALDFFHTSVPFSHDDPVLLLQPTSPFRTATHIREALDLFDNDCEALVSVRSAKCNPYFDILEVNNGGWLTRSKPSNVTRRQDAPEVFQINGAIYITTSRRLKESPLHKMEKIKKYEMSIENSIDIDNTIDWELAEIISARKCS